MKDLIPIPNSCIFEAAYEYVKGMKNREIIIDRYIELLTFEQLAEKHDLSVSTVKRIVYKYGDKVLIEAEKAVKAQKKAETKEEKIHQWLPAELVGI